MLLEPEEIFTFLIVMLGPLTLPGPFVQRTRGLDRSVTRRSGPLSLPRQASVRAVVPS